MSRRRAFASRSPRQWGVRGALALAAAVAGYVSVSATYAYSIRGRSPERAHALAAWDGRLTATLAQEMAGPEATKADLLRAGDMARTALLQDPTAVSAASTLGLATELRGDRAGARRLFAYATKLSRRDMRTQLWAIEDAVARDDIPGALRHYDIALRTSRTAPDLLFPVLTGAIVNAPVRGALATTLAARPIWAPLFIEYAAANSPDPGATALLFSDLHRRHVPVAEVSRALLVDALASRGDYARAWAYYASFRRVVARQRSRDADFTADPRTPTLFDWQIVAAEGLSAAIEPGDARGLIDFASPASVGGALVRQVQMLPAGSYRLAGRSIAIDLPEGARPYWSLTCREGREIGRIVVPNSAQNGGNFAGRIDVPADCPVQVLTLVAAPSEAVGGASGQFDRLALTPLTEVPRAKR